MAVVVRVARAQSTAEVLEEARALVLSDRVADEALCYRTAAALGRSHVRSSRGEEVELSNADSRDFKVLTAAAKPDGPLPWALSIALRLPLGTPARVSVTRLP